MFLVKLIAVNEVRWFPSSFSFAYCAIENSSYNSEYSECSDGFSKIFCVRYNVTAAWYVYNVCTDCMVNVI